MVSRMDLRVSDDPSNDAATWIARRLRDSVRRRGVASLAVSGGSTAPPMFEVLATLDVPWEHVTIWQVDERVAPDGHPERNAGQLGLLPARCKPMPVTSKDLRAAAARYGRSLPAQFDVVHLGLGPDGHTASWPAGHDVLGSTRPVEAIGEFNGFERMTLTPPVVNHARARVMLTWGADKASMVERWFLRDPDLPVTHLRRAGTIVFADPTAAADLPLPDPHESVRQL
jgi:6-phosphogluconolactonase/glucosamine-6-phosphate isomerase/deaminase